MVEICENAIAKLEVRESVLKACRTITKEQQRSARIKICEDVQDIINRLPRVRTVAVYHAINHEVSVDFLAEMLASKGVQVALPRVKFRESPLVFNAWDLTPLHDKDVTGILCSMGVEVKPDVVVVPMVSFNEEGFRLGYGGGYYDRTFAELGDDVYRIGVAYELQMSDAFTMDSHDLPMNAIVTEKKVRKIK